MKELALTLLLVASACMTPPLNEKRDLPPSRQPVSVDALMPPATDEQTRAPPPAPSWRLVHELKAEGPGFAFLSVSGQRWFAPGSGFILEGREQDDVVDRRELPGRFIQRVGVLENGAIIAVGSPHGIWELNAQRWRQMRIEGRKRRGQFADVMAYVDEVQDHNRILILASGPVALAERSTSGRWSFVTDPESKRLMRLASKGPEDNLACSPLLWRWFGRGHGWYVCEDGRSFVFDGAQNQPLPEVSAECTADAGASNVTEHGIAFACGRTAMLLRTGATRWQEIPTPEDLHSVALGPHCALANSKRAIWRFCDRG